MKKNSLENFISLANQIHNNKYDYSNSIYYNNYTNIEIVCHTHGAFFQTPKNHYVSGCKLCADFNKSNKNFIKKASEIHNNKYGYSDVIYVNQLTKVIILCPIHGKFEQLPKVHINGSGCRKCYDNIPKHNTGSLYNFISNSSEIHNNKYDYSQSIYIHSKLPIKIICKTHGEFCQTPNSHMRGNGCPDCVGVKKLTNKIFVERSNVVHDYKYDYSKCSYVTCYDKVQIICPLHGSFLQVAQDHLGGHGCFKCYKNVSKMETKWLDYLGIPDEQEHRNVYIKSNNKKYKVDGFYNNIVYEFYGDFWHGNPKIFNSNDINLVNKIKFGELHQKTLNRENEIKKLGYNIISIWEYEWKAQNET